MGFAPGDAILVKDPRPWDDRRHLYIVITASESNPKNLMLLPCVETRTDWSRDLSCTLEPGDHPFLKSPSVVNYRDAIAISPAGLDELIVRGHGRVKESVSPEVLARIIEGARRSPNLDLDKRAMLPPEPDGTLE